MVWLFCFFALGACGLAGLLMAMFGPKEHADGEPSVAGLGIFLVALVIIGQLLVLPAFSVHQVDAREIGVIKEFGKIVGQTDCRTDKNNVPRCGGFTLIAPWRTLETVNIREYFVYADGETCRNSANKCIDAGDSEQQDVYITPKMNIQVAPENVQALVARVGTEYVDKVVRPLMLTTIKAVTVEHTATDIHVKRTLIEQEVQARVSKELASYSIVVTRVTFENIDFSDSYNKSIELKVAQNQKALEEENKIATIIAQAKQAEEAAKGRASAAIADAIGQAEANRLLSQSLTPNLIQWQAIQKLQDNINIALVPSNGGLILDVGGLGLQPAAPR